MNWKYILSGLAGTVLVVGLVLWLLVLSKDDRTTPTVIDLEPGQKLENVVWREDTAWYLTRLMKDDEEPEIHYFSNYLNSEREPIVIREHAFE